MENKNIIWFVAIPVSIAFAAVSVLLWLSGGNNKYLVSRKLKLGALIIGITGVMGSCRPPVVTCYKPAMIPQVIPLQKIEDGRINVETGFQNLEFDCDMIFDEHVSWIIYSKSKIVEKGNCILNHTDSGLKLTLDPLNDFESGIYKLGLYYGEIDSLGESQIPFKEFEIEVIGK